MRVFAIFMKNPFEEWVSQELIDQLNITQLQSSFESAKPFPFLCINNLFNEQRIHQIIAKIKDQKFTKKYSDLFSFSQTHDFAASTDPLLIALRQFLLSEAFMNMIESITGFSLKRDVIDLHATLYTDHLLCHDDQLDKRRIAFMIYLSDLDKKDGGYLELYSEKEGNPHDIAARISPQTNMFLMFEVSDISFHSVAEVVDEKQRYALAGWFHEQD